jgi:hypothetical protein
MLPHMKTQTTSETPALLKVDEAADRCRVSRPTMYRHRRGLTRGIYNLHLGAVRVFAAGRFDFSAADRQVISSRARRSSSCRRIEPGSHAAWNARRCRAPYSTDIDGIPHTFNRESRLRGDHPAVRAHPEYWAPDSPGEEGPHFLSDVKYERHERDFPIADPIPDSETVLVDESFSALGRGYFPRGTRVRRTDPIVKENPHLFREVGRRLDEIDAA